MKALNMTVQQVTVALNAVLAIPPDQLERLVQQAHESNCKQKDAPPERFPVSRQALRMLWHFRCNLDAVRPFTAGELSRV